MDKVLSKNAQSVQAALDAKGLVCEVIELPDSARTAMDAAQALGCDVSQIVKSLIFKTSQSYRPVLILVSGSNRVNEKVVESHVGERLMKADADFTREVTGFAIGGIPPVGHKEHIDLVFIDEDLLKCESIWAAAGTPHAVFNMKGADLLEMTGGQVIGVI